MSNTLNSSISIRTRGLLLVLSSPSGAGKSTIARALIDGDDYLCMSVSATTRPPRSSEVEGEDYFFVCQEKFNDMIKNEEFLEYATVFDNSYGTPKMPVEKAVSAGLDVLFDVDWQGAQKIQEHARDVVSIFVLPPSIEELERRLLSRAQDGEDSIRARMAQATSEMSHWSAYQYIIVNRDIDESVANVRAILRAERLRRTHQSGLMEFVRNMGVGQ